MKIVPVFYIYAFLLTFCCLFSISIKVKQTNMETVEFVQVVSRGCGLDVHKKTVVATIDGEGLKRETREFGTFTNSLTELKDWLLENGITHVAMESTGVYWKPVYNVLEPSGIMVWIVNARHVKNVPGHKTDKKDSAWICKLLLAGLLKPSYIPPKEQRELRDLTRYRRQLIQDIASNKNRIIRILEDCNVKISSVLSNTSGVTATKLIEKICDGKSITMEDIDAVYHKKIEATKEELWEACNGIISDHHIYMLQTIRENNRHIERLINELNQQIKKVLSPYDNALERLREIPGLSRKTVEDLIAEIGLDMNVFPTEHHLASWVGVSPGNNESAGKKKVDELRMETSKPNLH
jgi:transposase